MRTFSYEGEVYREGIDVFPFGLQVLLGQIPTITANDEIILTAPGFTDPLVVAGTKTITCVYEVAEINTSVTVRLEGSLNGSRWVNLDPLNVDTTKTSNGVYGLTVPAVALLLCRFRFVGEEGGSNAVITAQLRGIN